jgi:ABC-type multidrug transport system fused ATPase/permease subunit
MNNPLIYLIKKMWKYAEFNRPKVVLYVILSIIANIIHSLDPILIGFMMNVIQQEGINQTNLPKIILLLSLFVAAEIVFWMFHGPSRVIENVNAFIVRNNYKKYLLKGVMDLPIEWHTDHHSGDTIDKIEKGTKVLFEFSSITFQIITAVITLITSVAVLFYFDISIGIITVVSVLLVFQIIFFFDKKIIPGYKIVNRLENTTAEKVYDSLSNIVTVIILRIESLVLKTIDTALEKPYNQFKKNHQLNEFKWFLVGAAGRLVVIVSIIGYILIHWHSGTILAGTIYIIYNSSDQLRKTFSSFAYLYSQMVSHRASVANAEELSKDFITNKTATHNHLPTTWNTILIKDLSFSYNTQDDADLHIDTAAMTIKKGERIAVIGESGGGKSTFLKLFRDLYHPKHVELIIDNKKTKENFASIRDSISLIPQDPEIFATTIRENITVGVEYADNIIKQYTDAACFSDVVARLPHGLESSIVEKGVNLSGGEKQRLALVRGLLASQDKEIVLLDEPTSSVDMTNELNIYQNIFSLFGGKTIISSIHRLHLLSLFDTIYFFKNGKIIASGSFTELKERSKDFQDLWNRYLETQNSAL